MLFGILLSWESVIPKDEQISEAQCLKHPPIRVVVRKEVNFQNRKTLFDSSCIKRDMISTKDLNNLAQYDEISHQYGYKVRPIKSKRLEG